jgi:hypothetical protein
MQAQTQHKPEDQPGVASAEGGVVILDGPNGVAIAMTPEAAAITGYSLLAAAEQARNYKPDA